MLRLPLSLSLLVLAAVAVAVPVPTEKRAETAPSIDGNYQVISLADGDRPAAGPDEAAYLSRVRIRIEKNKMTTVTPDATITSDLVIDYAKSPITIDISPTNGPQKGKQFLGIFKREGNVLTICYPAPDKAARPTEFKLAEGLLIATLKIVK